jgi:hypothetical protein
MGLKKGYFKNLKGGVNNSPIKFHDGTQHSIDPPNKRRPNVQIDNTRVNNKFNFNKSNDFKLEQDRLSELDNKRRNKVNEDFRKARLDQMKEKYPNASEAELKNYLFSNKPGLMPDASSKNFGFGNTDYGYGSEFNMGLTNPNFPSDATLKQGFSAKAYGNQIVDPRDYSNFLFGLNNEEKRKAVAESIENMDLDVRDKLQNYQKQSLQNFANWYGSDITRERIKNQAQHSGNIREANFESMESKGFGENKRNIFAKPNQQNVAGSLYSEADIDNILSSLKDKRFKYGYGDSAGYIDLRNNYQNPNAISGSIDEFSEEDYKNIDWKNNDPFPSDASMSQVITSNDDIYINKDMVNAALTPLGSDPRFNYQQQDLKSFMSRDEMKKVLNDAGITNSMARESYMIRPSLQNQANTVGGHELTHSTGIDKAMDPFLRSVLQISPGRENRRKNYNTSPGELYANFHELRLHLGMEPGEQWDSEKLRKRLEERGRTDQQDFLNNFTEESLIKALNTVADVDDKDDGKLHFDYLKSKNNSNYEMNA